MRKSLGLPYFAAFQAAAGGYPPLFVKSYCFTPSKGGTWRHCLVLRRDNTEQPAYRCACICT